MAACGGNQKIMEEAIAELQASGTISYSDLEGIVTRWPELHGAWEILTNGAYQNGFYTASDAYARKGLAAEPGCAGCQSALGLCWIERGNFDEADATFKQLCTREPRKTAFWENWSLAWSRQKKLDVAIRILSDALEKNPGEVALLSRLHDIAFEAEEARDTENCVRAWELLRANEYLPLVADRKLFLLGKDVRPSKIVEPSAASKRWLLVNMKEDNMRWLQEHSEGLWSGSKKMVPGDVVFIYFGGPEQTLRFIGMVESVPMANEDPDWGFSHSVYLSRITELPNPISLDTLKGDPRLKGWGAPRSLQGAYKEVPGDFIQPLQDLVLEHNRGQTQFLAETNSLFPTLSQGPGLTHARVEALLALIGERCGYQVRVTTKDLDEVAALGVTGRKSLDYDLAKMTVPLTRVQEKTIGNVDVLWMANGKVMYAIEVENSTNIYEGVNRMSTVPPNARATGFRAIIAIPSERISELLEKAKVFDPSLRAVLHYCSFEDIEFLSGSKAWKSFGGIARPVG